MPDMNSYKPSRSQETGIFSQKSFCKILENEQRYHKKLLLSSFHLNGHTWGFGPQTEKSELH